MKATIANQNRGRCFRSVLLMLAVPCLACALAQAQPQTYLWSFDTDDNPETGTGGQAEVTVEAGGTGWQDSLEGLPGASGFWDLGQGGLVRVALAQPVSGPAEITVDLTQWYDGFLYANLLVSVPNASQASPVVSTSQTASSLGQWQTLHSVWSVAGGATVTEALVEAPFSGVVDAVAVTVPTAVVAPLQLSIRSLGSGQVELSWPADAGAATLESRPVLAGTEEWSPVAGSPLLVGDRFVMTVAADEAATFFRLQQ